MSLYISQQQIYLNVSMLLLSRSDCALPFQPPSESHVPLPRAPQHVWITRKFEENKNKSDSKGRPLACLGKLQENKKAPPKTTKKRNSAKKPTRFYFSGSSIRCWFSSIFCLLLLSFTRSPSSKWSSRALERVWYWASISFPLQQLILGNGLQPLYKRLGTPRWEHVLTFEIRFGSLLRQREKIMCS